jgi:hypothetical protein
MSISAIRRSGESAWDGTPSQRFWDQVEPKQESQSTEFLELMRAAILTVDKERNKVKMEFRKPRMEEMRGDDMNAVTKTCGESSLLQSDFPETNLKDLIEVD